MDLEGNEYCSLSCDVKGLVSRDYSRLVFIQYNVSGGHKNKKMWIRRQKAKQLLIWVWKETTTALYLAMLKG